MVTSERFKTLVYASMGFSIASDSLDNYNCWRDYRILRTLNNQGLHRVYNNKGKECAVIQPNYYSTDEYIVEELNQVMRIYHKSPVTPIQEFDIFSYYTESTKRILLHAAEVDENLIIAIRRYDNASICFFDMKQSRLQLSNRR